MPEVGVAATALTDAAAAANTTDSATHPAEAGCNDDKQGSSLPTDSEMNSPTRDPMSEEEGQQGGQQQQRRHGGDDDDTGQEKDGSNEEVSRGVLEQCRCPGPRPAERNNTSALCFEHSSDGPFVACIHTLKESKKYSSGGCTGT